MSSFSNLRRSHDRNIIGPLPIDARISYLITRVRDLGDDLVQPLTLASLDKLAKRTQAPAVRVIVVGEVSRGKSTLINGLIGQGLLPDAAGALTSTWTVLRHGPQLVAEATIVNPRVKDGVQQVLVAGRQNIDAYMTVRGERLVRKNHGADARVVSVEIEVPAPILARGLQLIDTPGVGGLAAAHRYATLAALQEADALLFVIKPGEPISATERRFLAEAVQPLETCVIVQTQRDLVPEPDEWLAEDMATLRDASKWAELLRDQSETEAPDEVKAQAARLSRRFADTKSVSVSALDALTAAADPADPDNAQLYANSGFPLLVDILGDVVAGGYSLHRKNVLRLIESIVIECQHRLRERITILTQSEAGERLLDERKKRVLKWLENGGAYWRPVLDNTYRDLATEVREQATRRADEVNRDYDRRFRDMSTLQLVEETKGLLAVPDAVLAELNSVSARAMTEAVEGVRALLAKDELDGPLTRLAETNAVFSRLPDSFEKASAGKDPNDLRTVLAGGTAVAGAVGLGVAAWAGATGAVIAAPIVIPFLIGAGAYLLINRKAREQRRTLEGALKTLALVCDEIKTTAVAAVLKSAEEAKNAMAAVITVGIGELEAQVEQDRTELRMTEGLSPEQRRERLTEAEQGMRDADEVLRSVSLLRGQL
jgi:hypothetical protein